MSNKYILSLCLINDYISVNEITLHLNVIDSKFDILTFELQISKA